MVGDYRAPFKKCRPLAISILSQTFKEVVLLIAGFGFLCGLSMAFVGLTAMLFAGPKMLYEGGMCAIRGAFIFVVFFLVFGIFK